MVGTEATAERLSNNRRTDNSAFGSIIALTLLGSLALLALALMSHSAAQEVSADPIRVSGNSVYRWQIGDAEASLLEGDCVLQHGKQLITADSVLMVVDGPVGRVRTRFVIDGMMSGGIKSPEPRNFTFLTMTDTKPQAPIYKRKPSSDSRLLAFLPADPPIDSPQALVQQAQYAAPMETLRLGAGNSSQLLNRPQVNPPSDLAINPPANGPPPITLSDGATTGGFQFMTGGGTRSVEILARGTSRPPQIETINRPELNETLILARGGVTVLIRDVTMRLPSGGLMELGTVSLSADRVIGWIPLVSNLFNGAADFSQAEGELYLEGDIVFRQGERIIYAQSMYYNVNSERGMVLDAEAITTVPEYQGIVRLKSEVMQQVSRGNFIAYDAAVTSSRMGVPRYWLQSERLQLTDRQRTETDPVTGVTRTRSEPYVDSRDNFVYFGGVPLLYWPTFATSLERPTFYLSGLKVKNDNNFGTQVLLDWDLFQLLGIEDAPRGVDWDLSTDYLSDRGPAIGTTLDYTVPSLFGFPGPVTGYFDTWVIDDKGTDRLGRDRLSVEPEKSFRGRSLLRHRHYLPNDYELIAEVGWISDRNFLEQYLENEWDQQVDHRTGLRLRKYFNSHRFDLTTQVQANDFFTVTEELPTLEHYMLGGSILGDRFTWSAHNKASYSRLNVADPPKDPIQAANEAAVPGEANRAGVILSTRQELTMPVQIGPVKLVPNVSGEAAHYGEGTDGNSVTRILGQAGLRASLSAWRVDPTIQSSLLNVRGLAHKVEWTAEYLYADSDTNLDELPLYDPLDDNSQEQFRRRFILDAYGGTLPTRFDPRNHAFRQGYQGLIAGPSDTIADDLQQFKVGLHQRWQTKRGLPGRERIADLLQMDVDLSFFPDADRDNFGETIGPATYDFRYHIGDRVSLLSDGYFDFFNDGLRSISAGIRNSRPGVGDLYIGLLSLEGPISSTVLRSTVDYRMNEKWIASAGTTYDFGATGNVGQSLALTRVGESLLLRVGVNVDAGRDNVGVRFAIEPRFWPRPKLGRIGGQLIPPPGVEGLE
ncbi:MAG: organic solvent tolerance protein OstA [Rubripirellula sp.]